MRYATIIAIPDDVNHVITSTAFTLQNKTCVLRNKLGTNKLEVFDQDERAVIVDNVGDYDGDTVRIVGLRIDNFVGSDQFIKVSVTPANQSALTPLRNDVLEFDGSRSFSRIVDVEPGVTN
jgi:hypothetical protein